MDLNLEVTQYSSYHQTWQTVSDQEIAARSHRTLPREGVVEGDQVSTARVSSLSNISQKAGHGCLFER
jgi:hypothetical protein